MVIKNTGTLSLSEIRSEFQPGGSGAISLSQYYGISAGIVVSGVLTMQNFYGKRRLVRTLMTPSTVLGTFGMSPWGSSSGFIDNSANWIWNSVGAQTSATFGINVPFQRIYFHNGNNNIPVTVHFIIDNIGTLKVNEVTVGSDPGSGWVTTAYPKLAATIQSGSNLIQFDGLNQGTSGNPAGLVYSIIRNSDNAVLMRSDANTYTT